MKAHRYTFVAVIAASLAGCLDPVPTDSGGATARELFDSTVAPNLMAMCSGCHVGPETGSTDMYLGQDSNFDSFYNGIVNDRAVNGGWVPASAELLTKGAHNGPAWTPSEANLISAWLLREQKERGTQPPADMGDPTTTARGAEMQWASCLSISSTEFQTTQAYQVAEMTTSAGACYGCHEPGGAGGAYWGVLNNHQTMFTKWQQEVFMTGAFQSQLQTNGHYKMAIAQDKISGKGQEKDNNLGTHPTFDCQQNNGAALTALSTFATQVQAKADGHLCPTPAFAPPVY